MGKLFIVENHLKTVGIMHSLKAGNDPKTVRRPIPRTRILENKETIESSPQVYTEKKNNVWSVLNKKRVKEVIKDGGMTEFGLEKITAAKKAGEWDRLKDGHNFFAALKLILSMVLI